MNKYEKALQIMCNGCVEASNGGCDGFNMACYAYEPFKELVNKATPKKMELADVCYKCPVCHTLVRNVDRYCYNCGQRIDTIVGDEDE